MNNLPQVLPEDFPINEQEMKMMMVDIRKRSTESGDGYFPIIVNLKIGEDRYIHARALHIRNGAANGLTFPAIEVCNLDTHIDYMLRNKEIMEEFKKQISEHQDTVNAGLEAMGELSSLLKQTKIEMLVDKLKKMSEEQ